MDNITIGIPNSNPEDVFLTDLEDDVQENGEDAGNGIEEQEGAQEEEDDIGGQGDEEEESYSYDYEDEEDTRVIQVMGTPRSDQVLQSPMHSGTEVSMYVIKHLTLGGECAKRNHS